MARVITIYLHALWFLIKQAALGAFTLMTVSAPFALQPPVMAVLLTIFVLLPLYMIAAAELAGIFSLFTSMLRRLYNSMRPPPPTVHKVQLIAP